MPNSLATIAACDKEAPISVIVAEALGNKRVQPILAVLVNKISPAWKSVSSSGFSI
jgi:hypothetical protein